MKRLYVVCLLSVIAIFTWGHGPALGAPFELPNQPDALVNSLYEQVVARHPLGIPNGEDMDVFAPYLSKALLRRLDATKSCVADWFSRNPAPNLKPTVGIFENGIFSGPNEEAEPQTFDVQKTELAKDGSSQVLVKLTWKDGSDNNLVWYVAVVVVSENGRPVVQDVLYLKDSDQRIDTRLSKALASVCKGARWVYRQ